MPVHKAAKIGAGVLIWHQELSNIGICDIGSGCVIHSHVWIADGVKIGKRVKIQAYSYIPEGVEIEDDAFIGPRVTFTNDKYPPSASKVDWLKTYVKRGAVLGAACVILPGITIGEKATVGAGSVVTKDVPPDSVVVGNPARILEQCNEAVA